MDQSLPLPILSVMGCLQSMGLLLLKQFLVVSVQYSETGVVLDCIGIIAGHKEPII